MKIRILMMLAVLASIQGSIKNNGDAPNFILLNQDNIKVSLDQFKGKKVILEWTNHECPFVKRHYDTENMQSLQREMADQNIVWLSIISSAPNKQGFVTKSEAQELTVERNASPSHVLFDEDGIVGRSYDAKTTRAETITNAVKKDVNFCILSIISFHIFSQQYSMRHLAWIILLN